jgi:hypothetical protein
MKGGGSNVQVRVKRWQLSTPQTLRRLTMSIKLSGEWKVSVKKKCAAFDQRIVIVGTSNGEDGTFPYATFGTKTLKGSFGIQVQYENYVEGNVWQDSLMRIGDVTRTESQVVVEIQSDDFVGHGDLDFNDLILEARRTVDDSDWCLWGQVRTYDGCIFNPCELPRLVIDDWFRVADRLPKELRIKIEPLLPQIPPRPFPPPLPPDPVPPPPPPPPWDYRAMRVEVPQDLMSELLPARAPHARRGAIPARGLKTFPNPAGEAYEAIEASTWRASAVFSGMKHWVKCHMEPARGVGIRVVEYDPPPGEAEGDPVSGAGDRDFLGQVITDDWGYYIFFFKWCPASVGTGGPDVLLQLVNFSEDGVPSVALESSASWNIPNLRRKDFCVPAHLVERLPDDVSDPSRIFQYAGNLPVARILTGSGPERGHATSQAGDSVTVDRAPFGGVLYLKGRFHGYPEVKYYQVWYRMSDSADGNVDWTLLASPLTYYNADFELRTVGPGPVEFPGVPANAYPNMEGNYAYSHPFGHGYKAYINTNLVKTGYLHLWIVGLDSAGDYVIRDGSMVAYDMITLRIDNVPPVPEIEPITEGAAVGAGCGLITIQDPNQKFPLTYRVIDAEGHLHRYYFNIFKCHDNLLGGGSQYHTQYQSGSPLHWRGTPDQSGLAPDLGGWVTRDFPEGSVSLFTVLEIADGVTFAAFSIELWAVSRSTDGRHSHLQWPRYVEVIGVNYVPVVPAP